MIFARINFVKSRLSFTILSMLKCGLLFNLLGLLAMGQDQNQPLVRAEAPELFASPQEAQIHQRALQRYADARLGMFIHWQPWDPGSLWRMYAQNIPFKDYKKLVRQCKGDKFDAQAIVSLAKKSGMRYITFVAKHHDSFCFWDTKYSNFNSVNYPMKRDIVGELSKACEKADIPLFLYYSLGLDWTHPDFMTRKQYINARPNTPEANKSAAKWNEQDFERYRQFCKDQMAELNNNYKIAGFWFDPIGGVLANPKLFKMEDFYQFIRELNPELLIFFKTGITGTEDILVGERELASVAMHYGTHNEQSRRIRQLADETWMKNRFKKAEIAVTSQGTWGWQSEKTHCLPAEKLYQMLEKAANNNANLLLNFGPKLDGSIPEDVQREFTRLGQMIQDKGYPQLNEKNWKQKRLTHGEVLDSHETFKTAR